MKDCDTHGEFAPIANQRGYKALALPGEILCYAWTERADERLDYDFGGVFQHFFSDEWPPILSHPSSPSPQINFLREDQRLDVERLESAYEELRPYVGTDGKVKTESAGALRSETAALFQQLERDAERLRGPFENMRTLLKVVFYEAENLHSSEMAPLWRRITGGAAREDVEEALTEMMERQEETSPTFPSFFAEGQTGGVQHFLCQRDEVLSEAARVHDRWWAYEQYAQAAMRGEAVPGWNRTEADDDEREQLRRILLDTSSKMRYIEDELMPEYSTWDERNDALAELCKRAGIRPKRGLPYTDGESMRISHTQWYERRRGDP